MAKDDLENMLEDSVALSLFGAGYAINEDWTFIDEFIVPTYKAQLAKREMPKAFVKRNVAPLLNFLQSPDKNVRDYGATLSRELIASMVEGPYLKEGYLRLVKQLE